jgi:hypothetical protein
LTIWTVEVRIKTCLNRQFEAVRTSSSAHPQRVNQQAALRRAQ